MRAILIVQDPANHRDARKDLPDSGPLATVEELGIPAIRITRSVAERRLESQNQIDAQNMPRSIGDTVEVVASRDGRPITVKVTLEARC